MALEIERKFLVDKARWAALPKPEGKFLHQAYLLTDPNKTIRIRLTSGAAFLTIKGRSQGATRQEFEYPIPVTDARELLDSFTEAGLIKMRYEIEYEGKTWEVDEFAGENEGLVIAEIELTSENEPFALPDWVSTEVTGQEKYYNSQLSEKPFKQW